MTQLAHECRRCGRYKVKGEKLCALCGHLRRMFWKKVRRVLFITILALSGLWVIIHHGL